MFLIRLDFTINGIDAIVFSIDGQYYAMSNTCIHRGALLVRDYITFGNTVDIAPDLCKEKAK